MVKHLVVEHLLGKQEALGLTPTTEKRRNDIGDVKCHMKILNELHTPYLVTLCPASFKLSMFSL